ncbi:3-oxoacyl-[acyl-carrier-protein] reductase [Candidatus Woesearchaeota archaeon]|nr:3-oxoacyl-[acyl-carrier-protein] reductase [Candidatus Woesearchaeota archaeon]
MLANKIALVTGASRGIGKAIAVEFARNGANVAVNYNSGENAALDAANEIQKLGRRSIILKADVSKYDEVSLMIESIKKEFGRIDILINNAGIAMDRTLKNMTEEEWNSVINVNLNGVFNVTKQALPLIPENGRIISISSIAGITGNFGQANYSASKAGIIGFTKSLAKELGKSNITVNVIAPGLIKSQMTGKMPPIRKNALLSMIPLGREGLCEEVAYCALFLASERAAYITGEVLNVNGGMGI